MKSKKKIGLIISYLCLIFFSFNKKVYAVQASLDCEAWERTQQDFQNIFNFCKIVVPLLVIGLSIFDFIKAITGKDDKDMKKAFNRLLKRLALAVVFFFLPTLLNFLLDLIGTGSEVCVS